MQALENDKIEALAVKEEKELLKKSAEEEEAAVLKAYQEVEDAEKAVQAEKEKREQEQEAFEYFQLIDSNQDGKYVYHIELKWIYQGAYILINIYVIMFFKDFFSKI